MVNYIFLRSVRGLEESDRDVGNFGDFICKFSQNPESSKIPYRREPVGGGTYEFRTVGDLIPLSNGVRARRPCINSNQVIHESLAARKNYARDDFDKFSILSTSFSIFTCLGRTRNEHRRVSFFGNPKSTITRFLLNHSRHSHEMEQYYLGFTLLHLGTD